MGAERQGSGARLSLVHVSATPETGALVGKSTAPIGFDRRELALILSVYGRKVGSGEWRDYAMDFLKDRAVFSIFARHSERPLYVIEKTPRLARKQGQYLVANQHGRILRRGHALDTVLRVLDPQLSLVN